MATKMAIAGGSNGDLASIVVDSIDLSNMTHIEFGIKVDVAVAADDLRLRLSSTANGADADKIITIPALTVPLATAGSGETWVRVVMDETTSGFTPSEATAIISVALEYNDNIKSNTIWLTSIDGTDEDSYEWTKMARRLWGIDKQARDLIFTAGGRREAGYRLIKLVGGGVPVLLTTDATVTEVPEDWIVYRAAAHLLESQGGGPTTDPEARSRRAERFFGLANRAKSKFQALVDARFTK